MSEEPLQQPLLPRVSMVWFFIAVTILAVALGVVRAAEQGRALSAAMVFTAIFALAFAIFAGGCFCVAYLFGAMERAIGGQQQEPTNPFIDGSLPEQIIPPQSVDSN